MSFEYPRVHFKCKRCAVCCGDTEKKIRNILLMKLEAGHISNGIFKPVVEFADEIEGSGPYLYRMKKTSDGRCVFLRGSTCSIYKARPLVCRFYPFELGPHETCGYVFSYTNECPCIGHGPELKREYFERLFAKSTALIRSARLA